MLSGTQVHYQRIVRERVARLVRRIPNFIICPAEKRTMVRSWWMEGLGFRVWDLGFIHLLRREAHDGKVLVDGGFRVKGLGFRVYSSAPPRSARW